MNWLLACADVALLVWAATTYRDLMTDDDPEALAPSEARAGYTVCEHCDRCSQELRCSISPPSTEGGT